MLLKSIDKIVYSETVNLSILVIKSYSKLAHGGNSTTVYSKIVVKCKDAGDSKKTEKNKAQRWLITWPTGVFGELRENLYFLRWVSE